MTRRAWLIVVVAAAAAIAPGMAAATPGAVITTFSVKEGRAYAYKISVSERAIEASRATDPCYNADPSDDDDPSTPYNECDGAEYRHTRNCPAQIAFGFTKKPPLPVAPAWVDLLRGGAGYKTADSEPPQSSPVRLNEIMALGHVDRVPSGAGSGGISSETYVDNDGTANKEAHTETDGFVGNLAKLEERCWSGSADQSVDPDSYTHLFSRSGTLPGTYHFAECIGERCSQSESTGGRPTFERARNIVHLTRIGETMRGRIIASLQNLSYGGGAFTLDSLTTYLAFETRGAAKTLKWSVGTSATGAKIGGVPVAIPQGDPLVGPNFYVGTAAPYVSATRKGDKLTIVAPGLVFGTPEQAALLGGAELRAGFGRAPAFRDDPEEPPPPIETITADVIPGIGGEIGEAPIAPGRGRVIDEPGQTIAIHELSSGPWGVGLLLFSGLAALLLMVAWWSRRFETVANLYRRQPLRTVDLLYRAFVKT